MIILGIEGSANKLGVGILRNQKILANPRRTFITPIGTGFMPKQTAHHHQKQIIALIKQALSIAQIKIQQVNLIAYTKGPGMYPPLQVCAIVARTLSKLHNIDLIGVNHCIGHIQMGRLVTGIKHPTVLYVSGGNTQILSYMNRRYRIFGQALDIAVGNCLDRFARIVGLSNDPAPGYNIEQLGKKGKNLIQVPYTIKGMDLSFSGIVTYFQQIITNNPHLKLNQQKKQQNKKVKQSFRLAEHITTADLCFSLEETVFAMLTEVTERAMSLTKSTEVIIVGGVGCNTRLQNMIDKMAKQRNGVMGGIDQRYAIDNGAMIGYAGYLAYKEGQRMKWEQSFVTQRFRTDQVQISWRQKQ